MTDGPLTLADGKVLAQDMDRMDPLTSFRDRFYLEPNIVYMDGNSLGLLSRDAEAAVLKAIDEWKHLGIGGWLDAEPPWFYLAEKLGDMHCHLVGANSGEVVVTGSTTVNLHALAAAFYNPRPDRYRILADELNFPSDLYALAGQARLRGYDPDQAVKLVPSRDGRTIAEADVIEAMTDDVALVVLPGVLYRSGQLLDMELLSGAAAERGILIGFDLSHSVGAVPHQLSEWGVDFAFWCTYKHINGGPGSVAGLYVQDKHRHKTPLLTGWWGSRKDIQFLLEPDFTPAEGAGGWQIGTPCILGMAGLRGALDIVCEAGIDAIRSKSLKLTDFLIALVLGELQDSGFSIGTPITHARRGGHVAVEHDNAPAVCEALRLRGIIPDFRPPDIIRLAPSALYSSFEDVWQAVYNLKQVTTAGEYRGLSTKREVT